MFWVNTLLNGQNFSPGFAGIWVAQNTRKGALGSAFTFFTEAHCAFKVVKVFSSGSVLRFGCI